MKGLQEKEWLDAGFGRKDPFTKEEWRAVAVGYLITTIILAIILLVTLGKGTH